MTLISPLDVDYIMTSSTLLTASLFSCFKFSAYNIIRLSVKVLTETNENKNKKILLFYFYRSRNYSRSQAKFTRDPEKFTLQLTSEKWNLFLKLSWFLVNMLRRSMPTKRCPRVHDVLNVVQRSMTFGQRCVEGVTTSRVHWVQVAQKGRLESACASTQSLKIFPVLHRPFAMYNKAWGIKAKNEDWTVWADAQAWVDI